MKSAVRLAVNFAIGGIVGLLAGPQGWVPMFAWCALVAILLIVRDFTQEAA